MGPQSRIESVWIQSLAFDDPATVSSKSTDSFVAIVNFNPLVGD